MPLGNLTSQFFANVYLNELDYFVKQKLKAKYYVRYVDDFVILHNSKEQLKIWKDEINNFIADKLKLELHSGKSKILKLENGVVFLGFRIFYNYKLLRKSNIENFERKFGKLKVLFKNGFLTREKAVESLEGWLAYASHADTYKLRRHIVKWFNQSFKIDGEMINTKNNINFVNKIKESEAKFSVQKTLFLYSKGIKIKKIAEIRKIKESTVWEHLANLIEHKQVPISKVLEKKKIFIIYSNIKNKDERLREIKERIKDESITFDEINCVLAHIKSKL
ncbi:MAG: helix-turn-helix domain-containing protein [Nanoarchaeota archaeon]